MDFFPSHKTYDFMRGRRLFLFISVLFVALSFVFMFVWPKAKYGTDFRGGTEVELAFNQPTSPAEIRDAVGKVGFSAPDVIKVQDENNPHRYLIRVQEVSSLDEAQQAQIGKALCVVGDAPAAECPPERRASELKVSPGGDKVWVRFNEAPDLSWIRERMATVSGVVLRDSPNNPLLQNPRDHRVEIQLKSKGDQLLDGLRSALGAEKVPETALRVEWIGPKAGAQLRDAAIKSIAIALVLIMAYIAFRFDVRYAPGAVLSLAHDAICAVGLLVILGREVNLTTVAALLTIIGYSVNDTVVVYDRVRENVGRMRGASFLHIMNASLSEMLGRTILSNGTTAISLLAFFIWGTGDLKDFALTLVAGIVFGTYSSIYVALPFTEWLDRKFFSKMGAGKPKAPVRKKAEAVV